MGNLQVVPKIRAFEKWNETASCSLLAVFFPIVWSSKSDDLQFKIENTIAIILELYHFIPFWDERGYIFNAF